ncbi:hypothetical protein L1887_15477 [Cichorium endivia]|nr:hypothetical protein L1887_15477 [Cichorium endivia]
MNVPDVLWGEAVNYAVYVLNRVTTKALTDSTPYEMWTGRKPHVGHLRVFGCVAHMLVTKNHLKKLDERSKRVVHLGIEKGSKAYRLLDPDTGTMFVSRNVIFEENRRWDWEKVSKIKSIPGMTFTVEGFSFDDGNYVDGGEWVPNTPTGSPQSYSDWADESPQSSNVGLGSQSLGSQETSSTPNSNSPNSNLPDQSSTPVSPFTQNSPYTPIPFQSLSPTSTQSSNTASSSTGGGAPKRYRLLNDLYEYTDEVDLPAEELMMVSSDEEPSSYVVASRKKEWAQAMNAELASIEKNKTWSLVDLPKNRKPIGLKWVFKVKRDPRGKIIKHKARIVAKGYVQKHGIDYDEVFAPVARIETIRVILALAGSNGWGVHHLDVKSAFLNGNLEEEVYVTQPEGFEKKGELDKVYKLSKALYGLKQAPRAWNSCLDKYLKSLEFKRCPQEYSVYTRMKEGNTLIIGVYVDDLLVTGSSPNDVKEFKKEMNAKFEMSDLGLLTYYLGIEVSQHENCITLKQEAYARNLLEKTRMLECNPTKSPMEHKTKLTKDGDGDLVNPTEYRSIVGGLRYLTNTRPDLSFAVGVVSRFMEKPTMAHLQVVKGIPRYIKGTLDHGLAYTKGEEQVTITGYSDSDLANDVIDRKSTGGMAFYLNGNLVSWSSQKQRCVALSSCEAEFMAATTTACQGIWLRRLVSNITGQKIPPVTIYVDNRSALDLMKNLVFHGRSKHIDIRYHFIRECVENGEITVNHVCSKEQKADILTKAMAKIKHEEMRSLIGVKKI